MKRRELIRHLQRFGCALADPRRVTTVSRHTEIADLVARKICRQLGIPDVK